MIGRGEPDGTPTILVVDDDPVMLRITSRVVEEAGYRVIQAADGEEALRLVRTEQLDLVVLDVVLPGIDGIEVCRRIKEDEASEDVYVMLLSGVHTASERKATGLEAGADDYVARPVSNRELLARIEALLRLKRARDELARQADQLAREVTERRRLERESEKRRLYLEAALDAVPDAVVTLDSNHRVLEWNAAAEALFGYEALEVVGRELDQLVASPDTDMLEEAQALTQRVRSGERVCRAETVRYRKDGTPVDVLLAGAPILKDDELLGLVAIYQDITERKRMEQELRESEERYRSLYSSIRDAILVADTERNIIDCNPAFSDLFGYTLDEIEGRKTHYVYESREEFEQMGRALEEHMGDPSFLFTVHYQKKSGEVFPGETNVFYLRNDQGDVTGFIGLIRDVTERRRMERELRQSRERYRNLVENQGEGIAIVDADETFVFANPAAHDIFGVPLGSLVGQELETFLNDDAGSTVADQTERRRAGQRSTYEVDIVRPDDERRTLLVTASPQTDGEGHFGGTFGVFRDITERRQMEQALQAYSNHLEDMVRERTQELREAQEKSLRQQKLAALGQLAGSINHELRGPLGNIKSGAYFLHMALEDPQEDVQETVDLLMNEVDRAEAIVRSLLNFVRTEEPDRRPIDVNDLVTELLDEVEIPEDVRVVREFDRDLPPVPADRQQLRQVFRNLITNAVEAMPQGGQLTVISEQSSVASGELPATSQQSSAASDRSLERPEDEPPITDDRSLITENWILVTIKDTGVGMSQEARERIFEPLFSTKSQGVGLGLALAQMLIEAHGGAIEVQSVEGQGSAFTVRLPLTQDREGEGTAPRGEEE